MSPELGGKWLELFKGAVPGMTRAGVLSDPGVFGEATVKIMLEETAAAARASGVQLQHLEVQGPNDIDRTFAVMSRQKVGGLIVLPSPMFFSEQSRIVNLAAKHRLPAMFFLRGFVEAGGLMSYGPSLLDSYRQAAAYVDRILKRAKPAELPVEQPSKYELVINLKTAKVLGLTIPPSLLARADEIIQ